MRRIDSSLIFSFMKRVSGGKDAELFQPLELDAANSGKRFRDGFNNRCWWPQHADWFTSVAVKYEERSGDKVSLIVPEQRFTIAHSNDLQEEQTKKYIRKREKADGVSESGVTMSYFWNHYTENGDISNQLTFESCLYELLMELYREKLEEDFAKTKALLIAHTEAYDASPEQMRKKTSADDLFCYLIEEGKKSAGNPRDIQETSGEILFCSYWDLKRAGMSALEIAEKLVQNDKVLFPSKSLESHGGTPELWEKHILSVPDNWGFLVERDAFGRNEIVGNYSFALLHDTWEEVLRAGQFKEGEFDVAMSYDAVCPTTDGVVIYLLNMSTNDGYQTEANRALLWEHFCGRMYELAKRGVFLRGIYGNALTGEEKSMFLSRGFVYLTENEAGGEVFYLNLSGGFPSGFTANLPDLDLESLYFEYWKQQVRYRQLSHEMILTERQLEDIATLIWETDAYVYPAMFCSREQARRLLPVLLEKNKDPMFSLNNLYIAKLGPRVVGIILHKKGPLNWDGQLLQTLAEQDVEKLPDTFKTVVSDYFPAYDKVNGDTVQIINCCVAQSWRRGLRLGTTMMENFLEEQGEGPVELYVLQETKPAFRLYTRLGFVVEATVNGFSADNRELPCFYMKRTL